MKILYNDEGTPLPYQYELPYEFDLLYDIKTMRDIEDIAARRPTRCDGTIQELVDLFKRHELPVPGCLLGSKNS